MEDSQESLAFDPDALREKYRRERERRLRPDRVDQYVEMAGQFAHFAADDPYVEPGFQRAAISEDVAIAIVGGGFSGLLAAARLTEQGVTTFRIIEAGGDFGGTWYWNRYPGAQCDTESYCYLPLLEELGYMPREKYSYVTEIFDHAQRIGHHYDLYERTHFQTRVRSIDWDESIERWHVSTDRGDDLRARFVVMALGTASRAKLPGIPGIEDFGGHSFHTSRWDYRYTGGDTTGGMTGLADKRVAVIGTGATAIQCVPRVAEYAAHLYVFQRTPSTVDWRRNKPTDESWWASLQPGWQRERRENFGAQASGHPVEIDLIDDGWTDIFRAITAPKGANRPRTKEERNRVVELADFRKMEVLRGRVADEVSDPVTAEALKPYYRVMCKRPTFNDEYLECFNRDNVTLVDVSPSRGVERITRTGVVAGGEERQVDLIIYATGFEISSDFRRRLGVEVNGRGGLSLFDHWADGLQTLHGFSTRGFPNWFYIGVSQNAFSVNMTSMFDDQARHIAYVIAQTMQRGATTVEPTQEAQDDWVALINGFYVGGFSFLEACTPGYYNSEGSPRAGSAFFGAYTPGINAFNRLLEEWREQGDMEG
ncbi:MAG: NAD(P)/FAD-dependent oxidoreductase, partial [Acidimicrobiaceae bacterium]|nr:NAD(P)/FAD-dependent oxidoreductase [Acidimicrobiaceae bacterium]